MHLKHSFFRNCLWGLIALLASAHAHAATTATPSSRQRRILYNIDGDSCMTLVAGRKGPGPLSTQDLTNIVSELTRPGSQVDTFLVCANAQVTYYPTRVGTLRGTRSTPEERTKWGAHEVQRFKNLKSFFDAGVDPYAVLLGEARRRGLEAMLTFRVNDAHGNDFLRTQFWEEHPQFRLGNGALDFGHAEVRDYVFALIEEALERYECDGLELDFQRFPTFFKGTDGGLNRRLMTEWVQRIRTLTEAIARKRSRSMVLSIRVPSNYGMGAPTYEEAMDASRSCEIAAWVKHGWIDFVTVSEWLFSTETLDLGAWRRAVPGVPLYAGIQPESRPSGSQQRSEFPLGADGYRTHAGERWRDGADGIYLFNFFTSREWPEPAEPPFEVLSEIGDPRLKTPREPRFRQDRFGIGFWVAPQTDERVEERWAEIAEANFTFVIGLCGGARPMPAGQQLALAEKHGLRAIVPAGRLEAESLPDSPAVWGYSLVDEPHARQFPELRRSVDKVRELRPGKLAYINLFPDYASREQLGNDTYLDHVTSFVSKVQPDVLSMDHYPQFRRDRDGREGYCKNLEVMRSQSILGGVPFWNFFNSMPYGPHTDPTEAQLRWQIYTSAAYGAKGVMYFCYWTPRGEEFPKGGAILTADGRRTRHYDEAKRLNARLRNLGPTLMQLTSTGVSRLKPKGSAAEALRRSAVRNVSDGDYLVGDFRFSDGRRAVLLNNYEFAYSSWPTVEFGMPASQVLEVSPVDGQIHPVVDDSPDMPGLQISLDAGEGRLFILPPAAAIASQP